MSEQIKTNSLKAWLKAFRLRTLGAIIFPVSLGSALAYIHGHFHLDIFVITLLCSVLLQIIANLVNDYGDFIRGSDTKERLGPKRAMQMGWLTKNAMLRGIGAILFLALALGLVLVWHAGIYVAIMGLISVTMCIWYTAGPKPLAYIGFSEIVVAILFGPLPVFGSYFVQSQTWPIEGLVLSIAPAALSTALIMTNNLRDIVEDKKNHKKTIAVRFGEKFSRRAIVFLVCLALLSPLLLAWQYSFKPYVFFSVLALIFPAEFFPMVLTEKISARFNLMLAAIGKALYVMTLLLGTALLYG